MAYLIKVSKKPAYWSGREDAVWVDQSAEALEFATKKEAEKEIKEISEAWGYSLEAVKSDDAPSAEAAAPAEQASAEISVEELRRLNSGPASEE